jgi:hypothetical protein
MRLATAWLTALILTFIFYQSSYAVGHSLVNPNLHLIFTKVHMRLATAWLTALILTFIFTKVHMRLATAWLTLILT